VRFRYFVVLIVVFALGVLIYNDISLNIIGYLGVERLNPFYRLFLFFVSNQKIAQFFGLRPLK